jgi:RND family efflux transporter MFP subunit
LTLPGTVEPDAYRVVSVTPLAAGRVTRVHAQLGDLVHRGQTLAEVFSPELAEAHTRYVAARAELEAHDRELRRTERLVEIGAASRAELERTHAEHTAQTAGVASARSRLELLGAAPAVLDDPSPAMRLASIRVPAPIQGVVTERRANVGLNVDAADALFTVVDLSSVWVVANVYEKDFRRVQVGGAAAVRTQAYPDLVFRGRVAYLDPQMDLATRTARLRVEVPNAGGELRLGMYVDVEIAGDGQPQTIVVPRESVQVVGDRHVVYVADPREPGRFAERPVALGRTEGEDVEVSEGLNPGERIVVAGSFSLRAEIERLGVRRAATGSGPPRELAEPKRAGTTVRVTEQGFEPATLRLQAGTPARVTFIRTTEKTCGTEVVVPSLKVKRALPLNEPVVIEFTPKKGEIAFACGMNMLRGTIVVE